MSLVSAEVEPRFRARLDWRRELTPSVRQLAFEVVDPEGFAWQPGQHVELFLRGDGPRFYFSIASAQRAEAPGRFELAVAHSPSSAEVLELTSGDAVEVSRPQGSLVRSGDRARAAVLTAGGTGVAPLRAMVQAAAASPSPVKSPMALLLGSRTEVDIPWRDELFEQAQSDWFEFLPTLSRGDSAWLGRSGYVQDHLAELVADYPEAEHFVCGSMKLVKAVGDRLRVLGVSDKCVLAEGY